MSRTRLIEELSNRDDKEWRTVDSGYGVIQLFARLLVPKMVKELGRGGRHVSSEADVWRPEVVSGQNRGEWNLKLAFRDSSSQIRRRPWPQMKYT